MSQFNLTRWLAIGLVCLTSTACGAILDAEPTPTPRPVEVNRLYGYLDDLKESNIAELREMERRWQVRFKGTVHRIEERKIRFFVEPPRVLADDRYIECNFHSNADLVSMREMDDVTVQGTLARALRGRFLGLGENGAVVFEECTVVDIHSTRSSNRESGPAMPPPGDRARGITVGLARKAITLPNRVDSNAVPDGNSHR